MSYQENYCRRILQELFGCPFPETLIAINPSLYIDGLGMYKNKKIGFEYNGAQHYQRNHPLNQNGNYYSQYSDNISGKANTPFEGQTFRDIRLTIVCQEKDIRLIIIPYTIKDIRTYITNQVRRIKADIDGINVRVIGNILKFKQDVLPEYWIKAITAMCKLYSHIDMQNILRECINNSTNDETWRDALEFVKKLIN